MSDSLKYLCAAIGILISGLMGFGSNHTDSSTGTLEEKAQFVASAVNEITPKSLGDGMSMTSVTSEGRTLVFHYEGVSDWRPDYSTAEMARIISAGTCKIEGVHKFIVDGGAVRIDMKDPQGNLLPSLSVSQCAT